jgi:hypothetical protein
MAHPRAAAGLQPFPKTKLKKTQIFLDMMLSKVLRDSRFSLNQPLKSADGWHTGILNNITKVDM